MTHGELRVLFLRYHQERWPDRRAFDNRTGFAKYSQQVVPYGIPLPAKGKRKKLSAGGPDILSIGNENGLHTIWYFELKTARDPLRPNQKHFADWAVRNNGKYYIVREDGDGFAITGYGGSL